MKTVSFRTGILATLVVMVYVNLAGASTLAVNFDNTGQLNGPVTSDRTIGWAFSLSEAVVVDGLGYWDVSPQNDLVFDHRVAIWSASGGGTFADALVSETVATNSAFAAGSQFRFVGVGSKELGVGDYIIGAFVPEASQTYIRSVANNEVFAGQVSFSETALTLSGTFHRPSSAGLTGGRYGPNFSFSQVPEPSTLAIWGMLGGLGLIAARRRRKRRA